MVLEQPTADLREKRARGAERPGILRARWCRPRWTPPGSARPAGRTRPPLQSPGTALARSRGASRRRGSRSPPRPAFSANSAKARAGQTGARRVAAQGPQQSGGREKRKISVKVVRAERGPNELWLTCNAAASGSSRVAKLSGVVTPTTPSKTPSNLTFLSAHPSPTTTLCGVSLIRFVRPKSAPDRRVAA